MVKNPFSKIFIHKDVEIAETVGPDAHSCRSQGFAASQQHHQHMALVIVGKKVWSTVCQLFPNPNMIDIEFSWLVDHRLMWLAHISPETSTNLQGPTGSHPGNGQIQLTTAKFGLHPKTILCLALDSLGVCMYVCMYGGR